MADETKAPQIESPEKITAKDLAEMVKQMRHNQRRCHGTQPRKNWQRWKVGNAKLMRSLLY